MDRRGRVTLRTSHVYFGDWTARGAHYWPDRVAVVDVAKGAAGRFTYRDLEARACRLARWLSAAGVQPGNRVGLLALNGVEPLDALFACAKLGAILVPYNWRLHRAELAGCVRRTEPEVLLHSAELAHLVDPAALGGARLVHLEGDGLPGSTPYAAIQAGDASPIPDRPFDEREVLALLFTGGTTGTPKAARITYRQVAWNTFTTLVHELRPGDVTLTHTPMFHTGGLFVYTLPLLTVGGRVVVLRRWDAAEGLRLLAEERATFFFAVPTQYQQLLEAPGFASADLSGLRFLTSGGAALPVPLLEAWQRVHRVPFKQGFGMTEFGPGIFSMEPADAARKAGSVGRPNQFVEARLVDEGGREVAPGVVGELWLRGPACCDGYFRDPQATAEAIDPQGWLHTGDLARRDAEGFHFVVGRRKDMFISGGENVYPLEIEAALLEHPEVALAAVVGVPDARWGEVGHAFVVLAPGGSAGPEALLAHLRERLARYKVPKRLTRLDAMPLTAAGKVLKTELRRLAAEAAQAEGSP
ncbi:class I adenylate-forming enzyme family protein [Anaeromyxobacter sp. Red801]|uniref:class I adenylate-forming enzyme family protein n=1 Tax=Anaeromyxobacter sp. Red801 TaxID=3411632 RepID=UPI003BA3B287